MNTVVIVGGFVSTTITSWVIVWKLVMRYQLDIIEQFQKDLISTRTELQTQRWRLDVLMRWLREQQIDVPLHIIYSDANKK